MLAYDARASQVVAAARQRPQPPAVPTGGQIRMARALLRLTAAQLARLAGVAASTIARCEAADGIPPVSVRTLEKIRRALEGAGVEFLAGNNGPGVRLRRRP
jgi:transcriptional regulator with XRE-family HTH domain